MKESRVRTVYAVFKRNQDHPNPGKRFPTIRELGALLDPDRPLKEKAVRTVLETMRCEYGFPVDYIPERGGHGFTEPVAGFPLDAISEEQVYYLIQSVKMLGIHRHRDAKVFGQIRRAVKKACLGITLALGVKFEDIEQALSFHVMGFDAPAPVDPVLFKAAMRAILRGKEVRVEHHSAKRPGEVKVCVVEALHLGMVNGALYLWHYDPAEVPAGGGLTHSPAHALAPNPRGKSKERQTEQEHEQGKEREKPEDGIRKFALTRIGAFEETGRTFEAERHGFDIYERVRPGMGAFDDPHAVPVRLRFTPKIAPYIAERPWHETKRLEPLADGGAILHLHVAHTPELEAFVLRWAGNVEVLEPAALRERMRQLGEALAKAHS